MAPNKTSLRGRRKLPDVFQEPEAEPVEDGPEVHQFKTGHTVQLKSGGPLMTVSLLAATDSDPDGLVVGCQWFTDEGLLCDGSFYQSCLIKRG